MNNIILKYFLRNSAINSSKKEYNSHTENMFKNIRKLNIINIIGKNKLFICFIILFVLFGGLIRINIKIHIFFCLIIIIILFYLYYNYEISNIKNYTINNEQKLNFIDSILLNSPYDTEEGSFSINPNWIQLNNYNTKSYIYKNPICIEFYYNNRELIKYNILNYQKSLQSINAMIIINEQIQIGVNNLGNQYEVLLYLQKMCLNYFQSIIYNLPSTQVTNLKFTESLKILHEITNEIVNKTKNKIKETNKKNGININYYPIYDNQPAPNDTKSFNFNDHFDFFN